MHVVGRVVTVVMTCLGIMWIPVVHASSSGLYVYTHKVMAYMAPPVTVVFVAGVFWPRANSRGAAACFAYGLCSYSGYRRPGHEVVLTSPLNVLDQFGPNRQ